MQPRAARSGIEGGELCGLVCGGGEGLCGGGGSGGEGGDCEKDQGGVGSHGGGLVGVGTCRI